ncbi:MAG: AMP-binding protein, partial [bacterium]|nr:AMP-binding protein [bacterium]
MPKHIEYPKIPLFQFLIDSANKYPDKPALLYKHKKITYKELDALSSKFALGLIELGVKRGDRVLIFLPNIPEYVIAYYGILKSGAVVSSASPLFKEMELEYQLNDSGAETIITNSSLYPIVEHICEKTKNIVIVGEKVPLGVKLFKNLYYDGLSFPTMSINPRKDTAVLQYTGGTTGLPKGAMMTHYNLVANAIQNTRWFKWTPDDVVLAVFPFCHTWSTCVCINSPILVGATIVLMEHFDPKEVLQTIEKEKVTICYGSAIMFNLLVNCPEIEDYDISSLRLVKAGAMPIPQEV